MAISNYWVGQIPSRPISIDVLDSNNNPINLATYESIVPVMIGSDNEEIDLEGAVLTTTGASTGRLVFRWPTDRSLFTKPGQYLLQLQINGAETIDFTDAHTINVRKLGGVGR